MCGVLRDRVSALYRVVAVCWGVCRCVVKFVGVSLDMCVCVHRRLPFARQYHKYQTYGRCVVCCATVLPHCIALWPCAVVCVGVWLSLLVCHLICVFACTGVSRSPDNITSTKHMGDVLCAARPCYRIVSRCGRVLWCVLVCG